MPRQKAPTNLKHLSQLIEKLQDSTADNTDLGEVELWLQWAYDFLTERKLYHKKQQIKRKMMIKLASEHFSEDELAEIDRQAEELVAKEIK